MGRGPRAGKASSGSRRDSMGGLRLGRGGQSSPRAPGLLPSWRAFLRVGSDGRAGAGCTLSICGWELPRLPGVRFIVILLYACSETAVPKAQGWGGERARRKQPGGVLWSSGSGLTHTAT